MFGKISDWFYDRHQKKLRDALPEIDWKALIDQLGETIQGYSTYLDTRHNGMIDLETAKLETTKHDIVGLVVTPAKEGLEPWNTEEPTKKLSQEITDKTGKNSLILLSRDYTKFVGYYAYVR